MWNEIVVFLDGYYSFFNFAYRNMLHVLVFLVAILSHFNTSKRVGRCMYKYPPSHFLVSFLGDSLVTKATSSNIATNQLRTKLTQIILYDENWFHEKLCYRAQQNREWRIFEHIPLKLIQSKHNLYIEIILNVELGPRNESVFQWKRPMLLLYIYIHLW